MDISVDVNLSLYLKYQHYEHDAFKLLVDWINRKNDEAIIQINKDFLIIIYQEYIILTLLYELLGCICSGNYT